MNEYIKHYNFAVDLDGITAEDELELVNHILEKSEYTNLEEFAIANIAYDDALTLVQSNDEFTEDAIYWLSDQPNGPSDAAFGTPGSTAEIAYSLAYTYPEAGTTLLDELLEYRNKYGRI
jgi:hypothetical protein